MNKEQFEDARTQRAAEWVQVMREGDPRANSEFVEWITESPANLRAFLTMQALAEETRASLQESPFDRAAMVRTDSAPRVIRLSSLPSEESTTAVPRKRTLRAVLWALTASCAIAAIAASLFMPRSSSWQIYASGSGQQRTVDLPDGSFVYLNAQSEVAVELRDSERSIRLTRGEALFDVAHDQQRPFRVHTRDAVVEAIGTQFSVNALEGGTRIAVVEGKVKVTQGRVATATRTDVETPDDADGTAALEAGQAVEVTRLGRIERDLQADVKKTIAWSQPELEFDGATLEEVVRQFNRHRRATPLRLEGVGVSSHHYTGIFNATDSESFAALLSREPDLTVETGEREIVIRGKAPDVGVGGNISP